MNRRPLVPGAKEKLKRMKTELSSEVGMEYNDEIYKGHRTSRSNGYLGGNIGGLMTKNMVEEFEKNLIDK